MKPQLKFREINLGAAIAENKGKGTFKKHVNIHFNYKMDKKE